MTDQAENVSAPQPYERATAFAAETHSPLARIYPAPFPQCSGVLALVIRDTHHANLSDAQRISHFPASPFVCLSWFSEMDNGYFDRNDRKLRWRKFESNTLISGSQSNPTVTWSSKRGRGGMLYLTVEAASFFLNIDASATQDRFVCARKVLNTRWIDTLNFLSKTNDDNVSLDLIAQHFTTNGSKTSSERSTDLLLSAGRQWIHKLKLQTNLWQHSRSLRQVERRVKLISGRSLQDWQSLIKTERIFHEARDRLNLGHSLDWASLALNEGFSD